MPDRNIEKKEKGHLKKRPVVPSALEDAKNFFLKITEGKLPEGKIVEPADSIGWDPGTVSGTPVKVRGIEIFPMLNSVKPFKRLKGGGIVPDPSREHKPYLIVYFRIPKIENQYSETRVDFMPSGKIEAGTSEVTKTEHQRLERYTDTPEEVKKLIIDRAPEYYHRIDWHHFSETFSHLRWRPKEIIRRLKSRIKHWRR